MAFEMYRLTNLGMQLSHNLDSNTPAMKVIHYLSKHHVASKDAIYQNTGANSIVLARLNQKGIIEKE